MSKFDINKPIDFARMTQQNIAGLTNLFAAFQRDQTEWNIMETSYTPAKSNRQPRPLPIKLHIFVSKSDYQAAIPQVRDSGGRRNQKIELLYTDGQTTEDIGRRGETFSLEVLLHGYAYRNGLVKIMDALQRPTAGTLLHPVRGEIACKFDTYELEHSYDKSNAALLRLTFIEHNFRPPGFGQTVVTVTTKLAKALAILNAINAMIQAVLQLKTIVGSLARTVAAKIQEFAQAFRSFLVDANATFNGGSSSSIPGIVPVNAGGLAAPATTRGPVASPNVRASSSVTAGIGGTSILPGGYVQVGTRFRTIVAVNDPLAAVPRELLSDTAREALAAQDLTKRCAILRTQVQEILVDIEDAGTSVELAEHILTLKRAAVAAQETLEQGLQSSNTRIINYTTKRLMTVREIAFDNGISPNAAQDIELLNPWIESVNYIPKGTTLKVPLS